MSTSKRKGSRGNTAPGAIKPAGIPFTGVPQPSSAAQGDGAGATATAASLRAERAGLRWRQIVTLSAAGGLLLLVVALGAALRLASRPPAPMAQPAAASAAPDVPLVAAPTAAAPPAPTVAAPVAAIVPVPTVAAPTAVAAPTVAAPVAAAAPTAAAVTAPLQVTTAAVDPSLCVAAGGLPVYAGAVCTGYDSDEDDGVIKHESTYTTSAPVDEVRRFYEAAFAGNGWSVTEFSNDVEDGTWEFTVAQALREVRVKIEPELVQGATVTEITLKER